jgi:glutamine amidotransferase
MKVAIVDLGCGNLGSVAMALLRLGVRPLVTRHQREIAIADRVILPGVGAAGFAMQRIGELGLAPVLKSLAQPALGICLGMHLLFERSGEGDCDCLGIVPGTVRKLEPAPGLPVPHMGWSRIEAAPGSPFRSGDYYYFAHSFAGEDSGATIATAEHGVRFPAAVQHENWTGVQFHPERSGEAGARFLEAFLT